MSNENAVPSKNIEITIRYDAGDGTRKEETFNSDILMMATATLDSNNKLGDGDFTLIGNSKPSHLLIMLDALLRNVSQIIGGGKHGRQ